MLGITFCFSKAVSLLSSTSPGPIAVSNLECWVTCASPWLPQWQLRCCSSFCHSRVNSDVPSYVSEKSCSSILSHWGSSNCTRRT
jgi:hypothetical protein